MGKPLQAGLATSDITPPVGVELCGYGHYLGRKSTGVHQNLLARALVLEQDGRKAVLVSCDLIDIQKHLTHKTRRLVEDTCGIPGDSVMISCIHTHSGPTTIDLIGWGEKDAAYLEALPGRIARAVQDANDNLTPVELAWGGGPCQRHRRQ